MRQLWIGGADNNDDDDDDDDDGDGSDGSGGGDCDGCRVMRDRSLNLPRTAPSAYAVSVQCVVALIVEFIFIHLPIAG